MKKGSLIRFISVCTIAFLIIAYNAFNIFDFSENISIKNETYEALEPLLKEEIKENTAEEKPKETVSSEEQKNNESVSAATGAVKGKIVSKYISPYNAPLSYNKAYVKNSTNLKIDLKELLNAKLPIKIEKNSSPQVLIMHTHTTESFMTEDTDYYTEEFTSRSRNNSQNMVKIGEIVAEKLNDFGIKTLHDKTQHDYPNYTGSYTRSAKTVKEYLKKYPSIKVVLDLHRDAVTDNNGNKTKLVTEIGGKKAAQVMLVMGSQSGSVEGYPNWKENLKVALKLQQALEQKYPTLARPLSLTSKYYNQGLTTGSMLIEFGTDVNTLDEACYSAEMVADGLITILSN